MPASKHPPLDEVSVDVERLSLERIDAEYKGQWVLARVTKTNEYDTPIEGQVVAHGTRKRLYQILYAAAAASPRPTGRYYFFSAGAHIRSGTEAMRDLLAPSSPHENPDAAGRS